MTTNLAPKPRAELLAEAEKAEQERQRLASRFGASQKWQYQVRTPKRKSTTPDRANEYGYAGRLK